MHDGGADRVEFFQPLTVLLIQIVVEFHQVSLVAQFGFLIGIIQAGIDCLGIDVKTVHPQRA